MSLPEISIRRPVFAWMLMAGLVIFGGISFMRMGVSQLPDVDFPVVSISLGLQGAAPEVMETDVVDVVENAVMTIQGVRNVTSTARNSTATVSIEFELDRNIDLAVQDVQAKLAEAQRKLPRELDAPVISKTNPDDQPIMWLAVESDRLTRPQLMSYVRDHIQDQFSTTPDVGDIFLGGYVDPNLRIWVKPETLQRYQLSVVDLINTVSSEHSEPPAGWVNEGVKEYNVRTLGEARSVEEFQQLMIGSRGGAPNFTPLRLGQVATIEEGLADIRRISRAMGKPAVGLGIRKQRGANAVKVATEVRAKIARLNKTLPEGVKIAVNFDSTRFIEESVHELNFTLLLSAILTALVCWLFLGSWSSTFNVLLSIPTSIVGSFTFLYFAGFTLNMFTLLGLSLAIGIVVDDTIMVLENIVRHRQMGKPRQQAALEGAVEVTFAAMAATVAVVAIFLPVAFMKGVIGKFFYQFGVTMTVAVLLSLVEAVTLTPMRCAQFVETGERSSRFGQWIDRLLERLNRFYARTLSLSLRFRWLTVVFGLIVFGVSVFTVKLIDKEFVPAQDQSRFIIRLQTPVGSSLNFTDGKLAKVERFLSERSEVARYFGSVGGFGGGEVNTGMVFVTLKPKGQRGISKELGHEAVQQEFMGLVRKALGNDRDSKIRIQDLSMRGFTASRGFPVEFSVQGPDWDQLGELAKTLMKRMEESSLMTDIDSDYLVGMPEIQVVPDRQKAAGRGVSVAAIGQTINAMISGVVVGQYPKGGHRYDIRLKLSESSLPRQQRISNLMVRNNRGELIPLSELVKIVEKPTLQSISRKNRERAVSVFANVAKGKSQQAAMEMIATLAKQVLPENYRVVMSGSSESFKDSFSGLIFAMVLGLVISYMVLASQFNSFKDPLTVLMALPFSLSGAFVALWLTGQSLNIYSMIGLILLMGIVKKNSILLVDFTNQVIARGENSVVRALEVACPVRLRPILMTSTATLVGAIPPALALGPGAESRVPMAISVIGGVLFSTVLTLYVVPAVYLILAKRSSKSSGSVTIAN